MTDLRLVYGEDGYWDLGWDEAANDLETTDALENAVTISIDTIARAKPSDDLPDNSDNYRGFWGDAYLENPLDTTGSRLWILSRSKLSASVIPPTKQLFNECLQWMVQDGVAKSVVTQAAIFNTEIMAIRITITKPSGDPAVFEYYYNWEAQRLARSLEEVT